MCNYKGIKILMLTGAISIYLGAFSQQATGKFNIADEEIAVYDLIKRVVPDHAADFEVSIETRKNEGDYFEVESKNGKILLTGNNGVSVASALNFYLEEFGHCSITWNGTNLNLPAALPPVADKIHKKTPYQYRYYLNYCTFNYTMSWWNWDRWQKEIDWMALKGINMPLAVLGQNSVWSRVYKSLGFTDKELEKFFSGPAYFNWFWMGNLDAWGGPLPQSWMKQHEVLQKKILERERSLGMKPILPAFTGHVPPAFNERFPNVKLKQTDWVGFPAVNILDPSEPMFMEIGKRFIEEEMKTYGSDHLYSADTFNENKPPTNDSVFLNDVSKKVYQSMASADPAATWVMQGWMFQHQSKFWQPTQIKALLNAVPDDKMIILDLWSEKSPVWNKTEAYYGKPWIWCMLHNFGGNISLYGRMENIAKDPANALHNPAAGKLSGIGLTPEGIEQNPVMYALMLENVWRNSTINLHSWLNDYIFRRYGKKNKQAEAAWSYLRQSVYADTITSGGPESIITGRPTFQPSTGGTSTRLPYAASDLIKAWDLLVAASNDLKNSEGYQFDVVDVTRQVMANYALVLQQQVAQDYNAGDLFNFERHSRQFLALIADMDYLLSSRTDFLLGKWINAARAWGTTEQEKDLYEKNARNLLTLWGDKNSRLHEYANKQWAGLLNGFYKKRWQQFFNYVSSMMRKHEKPQLKLFEEDMKNWEWQWIHSHDIYTTKAEGDAVDRANEMYHKYYQLIKSATKE